MVTQTNAISTLKKGTVILLEKISTHNGSYSKFRPGQKRSGILARDCIEGKPLYFGGDYWQGSHVTSEVRGVYLENDVLYLDTRTSCYQVTIITIEDEEFKKWSRF